MIYDVNITSSLPECPTNVTLVTTCGENNEPCPEFIQLTEQNDSSYLLQIQSDQEDDIGEYAVLLQGVD